jgi:hypothetical protein
VDRLTAQSTNQTVEQLHTYPIRLVRDTTAHGVAMSRSFRFGEQIQKTDAELDGIQHVVGRKLRIAARSKSWSADRLAEGLGIAGEKGFHRWKTFSSCCQVAQIDVSASGCSQAQYVNHQAARRRPRQGHPRL